MPVNSSTASGYVLNLGTVGIAGTLLGMPLEALILGAIAGAVVHGLTQTASGRSGLMFVLTSTLLAGAFSPVVMLYLVQKFGLNQATMQALVPIAIGGGWVWLAPLVNEHLMTWLNGILKRFTGAK